MKIRKALTENAEALTALALEAKRYWGYPEHWINHWQSDLTINPEYVSNNEVFVAEDDGKIVGFYALTFAEGKAELDHLWVSPERIGSGVGKELFVHAMQKAAGEDAASVEIVSDPNAEGFYRKMGAYRVGETTSEIDGQPRVLPRLAVDPKSS